MVVSEFIEWLKTQDQGAIVEVVLFEFEEDPPNIVLHAKEFSIDNDKYEKLGECWEYGDFRNHPYLKEGDENYNKRFLLIGGEK